MHQTLQEEIRQTRPFGSLEQEAALSIERTAAALRHSIGDALRPFDLTPAQLNVLRILRGAGQAGLCRHEIGDRLIARVPDVTRLLDRMEEAGLVSRERSAEDRRQVRTRITEAGLALLARTDAPLDALHARQLGHLSQDQLRTLVELLALARRVACQGKG
ncbi:MAG TPA: MarR family transcriptional regulator [Gemmatirosa sp.]|jgi:DNA-binding MarR family transcriptional regulator|nr:MarR family transcriptional regulator [Gemmatirosa sp.]